jgi:hypothetical protein
MLYRRSAWLFLLALLTLAAWRPAEAAAIGVVGTTPGQASSADTLQVTRTVGANTLLVACAATWNPNGDTLTVSDGDGSYTQAFTRAASATFERVFCHYRNNTTAGSKTVTFDAAGGSADYNGFVVEVSGAATSSPLDVTVTGEAAVAAGASFTTSLTTATLAQANNLVIGIMGHSLVGGIALSPGATFTQLAENESQTASAAFNAQYKTVAATTAVTVPWAQANNSGGAGAWIAGAAVFKELVSSDVTTPTNPSSLNATAITSSRIDLTWTGSGDDGVVALPQRPRLTEAP